MGNMMLGRLRHDEPMTAEDYLSFEERSETRHEFVDGVVYAMTGARAGHGLIAGNLFADLHRRLPERCSVFMSDFKVMVKTRSFERFYYPDIVVSCTRQDMKSLFCAEPQLIVEVLSESTGRIDRTEKFEAYKHLPSLAEYLLVHQTKPLVELYRRDNDWAREVYKAEGVFELPSLGLAIAIDDLYRRVEFAADEPSADE